LVALVTIGTIPYGQLAGSTTALTDAAARFWPNGGVQVMALAGIVATLTSINSAMLSATREAVTLSREKVWPHFLSRLSHWRTPYTAIIVIVLISALVAAIGVVDLLSFISSTGYLFVLFWASLAMMRLHKKYPNIERPFKVPFFPLTAYLAAGAAILITAFADPRALLFLGAVLAGLTLVFFIVERVKARAEIEEKLEQQEGGGRILVAAIHKDTAVSLVQLAVRLVDRQEDTSICIFPVLKTPLNLTSEQVPALLEQHKALKKELLAATVPIAQDHDVGLYVKQKSARRVEQAIYSELKRHKEIQLVMLGFPRDEQKIRVPHNILKEIVLNAERDVAVLRDRGLRYPLKNILVPVGNGPNARLALRIAQALADSDGARVTALRVALAPMEEEALEDQKAQLQDIVEFELGSLPENLELQVKVVESVVDGILEETQKLPYDLILIGAAEEVLQPQQLFGELNDALLDEARCSMLIMRHYQPEGAIWLHRQIKRIEEYPELHIRIAYKHTRILYNIA
jgi:nucleotide-binding universal stress UspA family protein